MHKRACLIKTMKQTENIKGIIIFLNLSLFSMGREYYGVLTQFFKPIFTKCLKIYHEKLDQFCCYGEVNQNYFITPNF